MKDLPLSTTYPASMRIGVTSLLAATAFMVLNRPACERTLRPPSRGGRAGWNIERFTNLHVPFPHLTVFHHCLCDTFLQLTTICNLSAEIGAVVVVLNQVYVCIAKTSASVQHSCTQLWPISRRRSSSRKRGRRVRSYAFPKPLLRKGDNNTSN